MPRGIIAPCHGCGVVASNKTYVRVGLNQSAAFCAGCLPRARAEAAERHRKNARRVAVGIYLASRRGAAA